MINITCIAVEILLVIVAISIWYVVYDMAKDIKHREATEKELTMKYGPITDYKVYEDGDHYCVEIIRTKKKA